jgi:hypothetical protein
MFIDAGLRGSAGITAGLMLVLSFAPTVLLQLRGVRWTKSRDMRAA